MMRQKYYKSMIFSLNIIQKIIDISLKQLEKIENLIYECKNKARKLQKLI
jgi:hypothetical protein